MNIRLGLPPEMRLEVGTLVTFSTNIILDLRCNGDNISILDIDIKDYDSTNSVLFGECMKNAIDNEKWDNQIGTGTLRGLYDAVHNTFSEDEIKNIEYILHNEATCYIKFKGKEENNYLWIGDKLDNGIPFKNGLITKKRYKRAKSTNRLLKIMKFVCKHTKSFDKNLLERIDALISSDMFILYSYESRKKLTKLIKLPASEVG